MLLTTDRLVTLGKAPDMDSEQALAAYDQRISSFGSEIAIARSMPGPFLRELVTVTSVGDIKWQPPEEAVPNMDDEFLGRLTVMRITGETVAAWNGTGVSRDWFKAQMKWIPLARYRYALNTPVSELVTPDSELFGDLESLMR